MSTWPERYRKALKSGDILALFAMQKEIHNMQGGRSIWTKNPDPSEVIEALRKWGNLPYEQRTGKQWLSLVFPTLQNSDLKSLNQLLDTKDDVGTEYN